MCEPHRTRWKESMCDSSRESKPLTHTPLIENDDYKYFGTRIASAEFSKACNEDIILRHDLITFSGFISYKGSNFVTQNLTNTNVVVWLLRCRRCTLETKRTKSRRKMVRTQQYSTAEDTRQTSLIHLLYVICSTNRVMTTSTLLKWTKYPCEFLLFGYPRSKWKAID